MGASGVTSHEKSEVGPYRGLEIVTDFACKLLNHTCELRGGCVRDGGEVNANVVLGCQLGLQVASHAYVRA